MKPTDWHGHHPMHPIPGRSRLADNSPLCWFVVHAWEHISDGCSSTQLLEYPNPLHPLLVCHKIFLDVNISETKRAIRNPLVVKQPEFQNAKTQRNPAIKKSATKKWILSGSHHGLNTRRSQWTKSGGSKGLQLEIAAHVVLYVGLDGMSAPC